MTLLINLPINLRSIKTLGVGASIVDYDCLISDATNGGRPCPPKPTRSRPPTRGKAKYLVKNWPEYDRALVRRGDITVWFEEAFLRERWRSRRQPQAR